MTEFRFCIQLLISPGRRSFSVRISSVTVVAPDPKCVSPFILWPFMCSLVCLQQDECCRSSPNDARVNLVPFRVLSGRLDIEPEHSLVPLRTWFHVDRGFFPAHLPGKFDGSVPKSRREADFPPWFIALAVGLELPHRLLHQIGGKHRCEQYLFAIHLCRNKYQSVFGP